MKQEKIHWLLDQRLSEKSKNDRLSQLKSKQQSKLKRNFSEFSLVDNFMLKLLRKYKLNWNSKTSKILRKIIRRQIRKLTLKSHILKLTEIQKKKDKQFESLVVSIHDEITDYLCEIDPEFKKVNAEYQKYLSLFVKIKRFIKDISLTVEKIKSAKDMEVADLYTKNPWINYVSHFETVEAQAMINHLNETYNEIRSSFIQVYDELKTSKVFEESTVFEVHDYLFDTSLDMMVYSLVIYHKLSMAHKNLSSFEKELIAYSEFLMRIGKSYGQKRKEMIKKYFPDYDMDFIRV